MMQKQPEIQYRMTYRCMTCYAKAGEPCKTLNGRTMYNTPHVSRQRAQGLTFPMKQSR